MPHWRKLRRSLPCDTKFRRWRVAQLLIDEQDASVLTSQASVKAAQASIRTNEAMVRMYSDLQQFEQIVAPFDGVITAQMWTPAPL